MSEAKHTPGPWSIGFNGHNINTIYGGDGLGVASTYLPLNTSADEIPALQTNKRWARDLANARLIAAAPDLLEALKATAAVCAGETMNKRGLIEALEMARAAIAKATGEK